MNEKQKHLNHADTINMGSYYTSDIIVKLLYSILDKHVDTNDYTIIDTSCGYGSFLIRDDNTKRIIAVDIDEKAISKAKEIDKDESIEYICRNSLVDINRSSLKVGENEKIIIVGNPPYNDTTSLIRRNIKNGNIKIDKDIKKRDLGISFLLSYNKLKADYICILHPLSYLIKEANFRQLSDFKYKLIDGLIINSNEFTSSKTQFPILIGLYKRDDIGMDYEYIRNYQFKVREGGFLKLSNYDTITNYVCKYPNKRDNDTVARFWTIRDINALKRNKTFIDKDNENTIYIPTYKLYYYCYIDIFKQYINRIPYYFGNCDIIINNDEFLKIKDCFMYESVRNNKIMRKQFGYMFDYTKDSDNKIKIDRYFDMLLKN